MPVTVGVAKETAPGERRVAMVPEVVPRLTGPSGIGVEVLVESGAGTAAQFADGAYTEAGARIVDRTQLLADADAVLIVGPPDESLIGGMRPGQLLIGLLRPLSSPDLVKACAAGDLTAVSLDGLPRTLPRAQTMDALSSQASVAGYKAVLVAATAYGRYFPMLITAAGTARPAMVLVLGTGVAGLQAIGTARRLGASVSAYDVRPQTRGEVESLGATFIELTSVGSGAGEGGYARELTEDEQRAQQEELAGHIARHDIVITTAQVPGRKPPVLVTADVVGAMKAGSVIVDLAASPLGGNVEGSGAEQTTIAENGVTVIGAGNLPATVPAAASSAYARNITALLAHLMQDGALAIDLDDEITRGVLVTHGGQVVLPALADRPEE
ncbi:MAG: NAD(P) transhydrogenase subunit alpha [Mycobacteriales bacterium]|nr:MAG: NAD(P) transhydrogenase subunit alpha [Pseudonocardiales bacterium]